MPTFSNLGDLIDRARDPAATALIDLGGESGARTWTFEQLDAEANAVARGLLRRGCRRGDRIAILAANRAEFLAAYYGTMRAGMVSVPVNYKFPRALVDHVLRDSGATLVFCDQGRRVDCPPDLPVVEFGDAGAAGFDAFLDHGPFAAVMPEGDEAAMFLYTSGSTGRPKGVVLSHRAHTWVVGQRLAGKDWSRHRVLVAAPLYHMNGLAMCKFACAAHATVVLLPQFSAASYIDAIDRYRCTWLTSVPTMLAMVVKETSLLSRIDTGHVEIVRMGSAPVSERLIANVRAAFPRAVVTNAYGTTEAGPFCFGPHPQGIAQPALSVGYPQPTVKVRLVAGGDRNAAEGVLEQKCPALMNGYHNLPDATRRVMTPDGYYHTGDVFRRDADGFHYFVGRSDDMFVCGGENIWPGEVEKMLETHPDVEQACVVPIADEIKWQKPVAFVVLRRGAVLSEQALKDYALANAPAYQHPRIVRFVDELPLASTNKVDRRAVANWPKDCAPEVAARFNEEIGHGRAVGSGKIQEMLMGSPFIAFMQPTVESADPQKQEIVVRIPFRPEFERRAGTRQWHGGPIASFIDTVGDYALAMMLARPLPTINFSTDYLRPAIDTGLRGVARVRRAGKSVGYVDVDVFDDKGALVAIGRACYSTLES